MSLLVKKDKRPPKLKLKDIGKSWMWKQNRRGHPLLVRNTTDATNLPDDHLEGANNKEAVMERIVASFAEGLSFHKLSMIEGYPHVTTMYNWYNADEDFRNKIDNAKKIRAALFHDQMQEVAETVKEGNAKSYKVKADVYKHLMAVGDREQYGAQTKVVGDPNQPVSFIVDTGIRRLEQNPPIPAESRVLDVGGTRETQSGDVPTEESAADNLDGVQSETPTDGDPQES